MTVLVSINNGATNKSKMLQLCNGRRNQVLVGYGLVINNVSTDGAPTVKKILLVAMSATLLAGTAFAADLPTRKGPPVAPVYIPPAFTWTGFYVGVNAGGAWENNGNNNNFFPVGAVPVNGTFFPVASNGGNRSGFIGGVQGGYNYQFTPGAGFVLGVEADIDWADIGHNHNGAGLFTSFTVPQFPGTVFSPSGLAAATHNNNNQWNGTVRLRAGYAWDRFLVYATGGLAYGAISNNGNGFGAGLIATTASRRPHPASSTRSPACPDLRRRSSAASLPAARVARPAGLWAPAPNTRSPITGPSNSNISMRISAISTTLQASSSRAQRPSSTTPTGISM
jgi:outer membrane immunogenic protein